MAELELERALAETAADHRDSEMEKETVRRLNEERRNAQAELAEAIAQPAGVNNEHMEVEEAPPNVIESDQEVEEEESRTASETGSVRIPEPF